ncbi:MAG: hypothetical protein ACKOYC_07455 [Bacteroidota bacterium]
MKKIIYCTVFLLAPVMSHGQGYLRDDVKASAFKKFSVSEFGFADKQPPATYSMRQYCPPPLMQEGSTCVGWAVAYGTMSTMFNNLMEVTDPTQKYFLSFDPNFLYSISVEKATSKCSQGVVMPLAIEQAMRYGFKRLLAPPAFTECNTKITDFSTYFSEAFKPSESYTVDLSQLATAKDKIVLLKKIIASGRPLPFGMEVTNSMVGVDGPMLTSTNPLWIPKPGEKELGGHAMTLIGYSDSKFGGAFEIMNSYGSKFGDDGFFWIKYTDFLKYVTDLYAFDPPKINSGQCKLGDCEEDYSVCVFDDGRFYEGTFTGGSFDEFGIYVWSDKTIYAGGWKNDDRHGKGRFIKDGSLYAVTYINDKMVDMEELGFASMPDPVLSKIERELVGLGYKLKDGNDPDFVHFANDKNTRKRSDK